MLASGCAGASNGATGNGATDAASKAAAGPAGPSCVPATLNVSAALAGSRVTVSPGPGVRDASATSQLSFLSRRARAAGGRGCRFEAVAGPRHRLAQRRAPGAPARLLTGRRRELRADEAVRRRGARDRPCPAARRGQDDPRLPGASPWPCPTGPGSASVTESTRPSSAPGAGGAEGISELSLPPGTAPAGCDRVRQGAGRRRAAICSSRPTPGSVSTGR